MNKSCHRVGFLQEEIGFFQKKLVSPGRNGFLLGENGKRWKNPVKRKLNIYDIVKTINLVSDAQSYKSLHYPPMIFYCTILCLFLNPFNSFVRKKLFL